MKSDLYVYAVLAALVGAVMGGIAWTLVAPVLAVTLGLACAALAFCVIESVAGLQKIGAQR